MENTMNTNPFMTRRRFLQCTAASLAVSCLPRPSWADSTVMPGQFRRGGMAYRPLGKSGLNVSLLAFGSHTDQVYKLPGGIRNVLSAEGQARRDRQISKAIDLGVNLIDVYEHEGQWEPLAKLVKAKRDKLLISGAYDNPEFIGTNIDRLARLYGGHIDLYRVRSETVTFNTSSLLDQWDVVRRAKEAGKIRAIGIACHLEGPMVRALQELEGLEFVMLPYNFIHAKADYSQFLPAAIQRNVGLIGIKPLAAGSVVGLDPRFKSGAKSENSRFMLFNSTPGSRMILPAVVAELAKSLNQLPDESLSQAAMRYVYSKPFLSCAMTGMFDEQYVEDNYAALSRYDQMTREEHAALDAAREFTRLAGPGWLPQDYRWLEEQWRA
jgi:aryl-alcohol dehydrogenase-like predicted oxidoreductase